MLQSDKDLSVTTLPIHPCLDGWRQRVKDAELNGRFSEREMQLAESWDTCAIGESRMKYHEFVNYDRGTQIDFPQDRDLNQLGYQFYLRVCKNNFEDCYRILDRIEARLNVLMLEA